MPALVAGIHVFYAEQEQRRGGRDIRAFTPVFDGLLPGHDDVAELAPFVSGVSRTA